MSERVFKTAWFARAARKARIADVALIKAVREVAMGQADDLGGGVFKKRLNDNRRRAIVLAKSGDFWVYVYLFAKQDRANIDDGEVREFRRLADLYRRKSKADLTAELKARVLLEIDDDD